MKILILTLILFSCGTDDNHKANCVVNGKNCGKQDTGNEQKPQNCSVSQTESGAVITCPDGTKATIANGTNGKSGKDGTNGLNGKSMVFSVVTATTQQCSSGGNVILMALDSLGTGVYNILDSNQQSAVLCNGANGANGLTPFSPMAPIQPCGAASSPWKEVLLCLNNGGILASFSENSSGKNTRLSFIPTGSYGDTDESQCIFNVNVSLDGTSTVSWASGSNTYSSWTSATVICQAH